MCNSKFSLFTLMTFILWAVVPVTTMFAQPAQVPSHTLPYFLSSGFHDGRGELTEPELVWREVIQIAEAP